jgi:glycosyltransferase involved in cell wall biosynthesis
VYDLAKYTNGTYKVLVVFGENSFGGESIFKNKLHKIGIQTIEISNLGRDINFLSDIQSFLKILAIFNREKPDIIHLNSTKIGGIGALAGRFARVPRIIYTAHGLPFLEKYTYIKDRLVRLLSYITFILSHTVILLSDFERNLVSDWWFLEKKLQVVNNGIKEPDFFTRELAREKISNIIGLKIKEDTFLIGSIAGLEDYKGLLEFLPRLAKLHRRHSFIYIHFGTGELEHKLKELTARLSLAGVVFWLGANPEASRYLKALDLFTLPSKKEGFPYVLLEAEHAGIPVFAHAVAGVPEMLDFATKRCVFDTFDTYKVKNEFMFKKMCQKTIAVYNKKNHDS